METAEAKTRGVATKYATFFTHFFTHKYTLLSSTVYVEINLFLRDSAVVELMSNLIRNRLSSSLTDSKSKSNLPLRNWPRTCACVASATTATVFVAWMNDDDDELTADRSRCHRRSRRRRRPWNGVQQQESQIRISKGQTTTAAEILNWTGCVAERIIHLHLSEETQHTATGSFCREDVSIVLSTYMRKRR